MSQRRLGALPAKVRLGRGWTVRVALVTPSEMAKVLDDGETPVGFCAGHWDDATLTIYVDSSMGRARQWKVYFHELVHAAHDIAVMNEGGV